MSRLSCGASSDSKIPTSHTTQGANNTRIRTNTPDAPTCNLEVKTKPTPVPPLQPPQTPTSQDPGTTNPCYSYPAITQRGNLNLSRAPQSQGANVAMSPIPGPSEIRGPAADPILRFPLLITVLHFPMQMRDGPAAL